MGIPRTPLLYIGLGFMGGVIITRNAAPMSAPSKGAVILAMLVGGFVLWRAGYKGKAEAVAVAVATAVATAQAEAKAEATAQAQAAINLYMQASPDRMYADVEIEPILSLQDSDEAKEIEQCQALHSTQLSSSQERIPSQPKRMKAAASRSRSKPSPQTDA